MCIVYITQVYFLSAHLIHAGIRSNRGSNNSRSSSGGKCATSLHNHVLYFLCYALNVLILKMQEIRIEAVMKFAHAACAKR